MKSKIETVFNITLILNILILANFIFKLVDINFMVIIGLLAINLFAFLGRTYYFRKT